MKKCLCPKGIRKGSRFCPGPGVQIFSEKNETCAGGTRLLDSETTSCITKQQLHGDGRVRAEELEDSAYKLCTENLFDIY